MTNDKVLSKIRKMLELAGNAGATEGERANALSQAHKWIAKYNIDMATAMQGVGEARNAAADEKRTQTCEKYFGEVWARQVSHAIGGLFFCKYFFASLGANTSNVLHTFVGRESNTVTAMEVARYVVNSIYKEAMTYKRDHGLHYSDYRAFANGAMKKVVARCFQLKDKPEVEEEQKQLTNGAGTALVLANFYKTEEEANAEYVKRLLGELRKSKGHTKALRNRDAINAGYAYGDKVSLNPQLGGAKPAAESQRLTK